jgi:ribonuclease HI
MPFFGANGPLRWLKFQKRKPLNRRSLNEWEIKFFPIFHNSIHRCSKRWARNSCSLRRNQVSILTPEDPSGMVGIRSTNAMSALVAYIDGGSFGNPGPSGIGVVISGAADGTIRIARWIGQQDNNVAEYVALLEALQCALLLKATALRVFSDSEVMVKQMSGEYSCRSPRLYSLNWICRKLAGTLDFSISHVRREDNAEANSLATSAARKRLC